jgi:hypothetical protein
MAIKIPALIDTTIHRKLKIEQQGPTKTRDEHKLPGGLISPCSTSDTYRDTDRLQE